MVERERHMLIRLVLAVCVAVVALMAVAVLTDTGRDHLRGIKAELRYRLAVVRMHGVRWPRETMVPMPDGTRLATDVYLPAIRVGPVPTVLIRLPYGKRRFGEVRDWVSLLVPRGYAVVAQDMRGRWRSEGVFAPWPNAASDGTATLDWIAAQDWSDGAVGTAGCSALGESQVILAAATHPAHRAMVPMGAGGAIGTAAGSYGFFGLFEGGIPTLATALGWFATAGGKTPDQMRSAPVDHATALLTLPLRDLVARVRTDPTDFEWLLDGFEDAAFHTTSGYVQDTDRFATPALIVDTWYDAGVSATLALSRQMQGGAPEQHVLIGPGTHCDMTGPFKAGHVGDVPVAPDAMQPFQELYAAFLDHHLKGAPLPDLPRYRVFALGADRWLDLDAWPPRQAELRQWALSQDTLVQADPDPTERGFVSDPTDPVPTLGGAFCCTGDPDLKAGPVDQSPIEARADVLAFTSPAMDADMLLAGSISTTLQVSADVLDTDIVARLTDVGPDGRSILIQEGALRLRYRNGFDQPELLVPDEVVPVTISLRDIAWQVPAGHRLRLLVSGSSFPRLARNMNTGGVTQDESVPRPARITVHSTASQPSVLRVHVLPE